MTRTMVYRPLRSKISFSITSVAIGSRALHGSSNNRISGLRAKVLARQSRCCWPPESVSADL